MGRGGADWEMKSASRANVAYERFLFLCFPFFYDFHSQRWQRSSLIIPNQQMNLGGKMDKPAGSGKTGKTKIPLKALKGKQIRLVGGGVGLAVSRLGINRIRHVNKRKRQSWKK